MLSSHQENHHHHNQQKNFKKQKLFQIVLTEIPAGWGPTVAKVGYPYLQGNIKWQRTT